MEKRQNIEICKNCKYFKEMNDPKVNDGKWHWGVGFMCACHGKMVPWRKDKPDVVAVTAEEFEQSHIYFAGHYDHCPQHPDEPRIVE